MPVELKNRAELLVILAMHSRRSRQSTVDALLDKLGKKETFYRSCRIQLTPYSCINHDRLLTDTIEQYMKESLRMAEEAGGADMNDFIKCEFELLKEMKCTDDENKTHGLELAIRQVQYPTPKRVAKTSEE